MPRSIVPLAALVALLVVLSLAPPAAQALTIDDQAEIVPGGHLVLMNFTVSRSSTAEDAGNVRYLVTLAEGSEQDRFDVLLMTQDDYGNYLSGLPFLYVTEASSLGAGEVPASAYHFLMEGGNYTLLIDNSDRAASPLVAAELTVEYRVVVNNVELQEEPRWDLFIGLMAFVCMIGMAFLFLLRISNRHRLERAEDLRGRRCAGCGEVMPSYAKYCPYCGREG